ncbi:hypothetical protein, partial [Klebsiella aerogenes]|uniref:hypothetical protein n=1 Tax=Klebsiella aerogenes TaxID=548 RepID=UPI001CC0D951
MEVFPAGLLPDRIKMIVENVQMFYNSMKLPPREDPMFDMTTCFVTNTKENGEEIGLGEEEEEGDEFLDSVFELIECIGQD